MQLPCQLSQSPLSVDSAPLALHLTGWECKPTGQGGSQGPGDDEAAHLSAVVPPPPCGLCPPSFCAKVTLYLHDSLINCLLWGLHGAGALT